MFQAASMTPTPSETQPAAEIQWGGTFWIGSLILTNEPPNPFMAVWWKPDGKFLYTATSNGSDQTSVTESVPWLDTIETGIGSFYQIKWVTETPDFANAPPLGWYASFPENTWVAMDQEHQLYVPGGSYTNTYDSAIVTIRLAADHSTETWRRVIMANERE